MRWYYIVVAITWTFFSNPCLAALCEWTWTTLISLIRFRSSCWLCHVLMKIITFLEFVSLLCKLLLVRYYEYITGFTSFLNCNITNATVLYRYPQLRYLEFLYIIRCEWEYCRNKLCVAMLSTSLHRFIANMEVHRKLWFPMNFFFVLSSISA